MRVLFALPGLHKYNRGAEIALTSIAEQIARAGHNVTLIGSGSRQENATYEFIHAGSISRERFKTYPQMPVLRSDYILEELTFVPGLLWRYKPADYDITITCSYPFTNWALRRACFAKRPKHVFITQNGDWPAFSRQYEYRLFGCDGLVCTNPDYYERNKDRWNSCLIPNGVDCERFKPGPSRRSSFGLPDSATVILMVSALIPSKRVQAGIAAVSRIPNAHLVVAGDGPLRGEVTKIANSKMPGRFTLLSISADRMPDLYRSADVFLHLSQYESFGNVFVEAMATGLPIVGHDTPRLRWIVGDHQFLTNTEDEGALIDAIQRAAARSPDACSEAVAQVKKFAWEAIGKMYNNFLIEVASVPSMVTST